jgi:chromosome condensin MukBEF MukE localization factor
MTVRLHLMILQSLDRIRLSRPLSIRQVGTDSRCYTVCEPVSRLGHGIRKGCAAVRQGRLIKMRSSSMASSA